MVFVFFPALKVGECVTFAGIGRPVSRTRVFACQTICLDRLTGHHATSMQIALRQLGHTRPRACWSLPAKRETNQNMPYAEPNIRACPERVSALDRLGMGDPRRLSGASRSKAQAAKPASLRPPCEAPPVNAEPVWFTCLP